MFGTTSGSIFGQPSLTNSLFGQTQQQQQQQQSRGVFGQPQQTSSLFGTNSTTTGGGGLFGSSTTPNTGALFGQSSATPSTGGGLFGTSTTTCVQPQTSLFGSPSAGTTGGLFGSTAANSSLFRSTSQQQQPSAFGTSAGGGGLFGSTTTPTNTFGSTAGGGIFGTTTGSTFGAKSTGTRDIKWRDDVNKDPQGGRIQAICNLPEINQQKCLEELRLEDYQLGLTPGKSPSGLGGFGQTTTSSGLFGNSTAGSGLFGSSQQQTQPQQTNSSLFGGTMTTPSTTPGGVFGGQSSTGGLFGQPSTSPTSSGLFGQQSAAGGGLFGQKTASTGGLFGQSTSPSTVTGLFGQTSTTGTGFGASSTQPSTGLFGATATQTNAPSGGSLFGTAQPSTGGGLFGTTTTPSTGSGVGLFGTSAGGGGLFGQQATTNQNSGGGLFGTVQSSTTGPGLFGQQASGAQGTTGTGLFGLSSTTGTAGGGLFSSGATGTTGSSLFGQPSTNNTGTTGSLFNSTQPTTSSGLFGAKPATPVLGTSAGLFGSTTGTGIFGQPATTGTSTSTTSNTSGLFAPKTGVSGGLFSTGTTGTSTGLFGQPSATTSTSTGLFGQPTSTTPQTGGFFGTSSGGLFGSGLGQQQQQTTAVAPQQQQQQQQPQTLQVLATADPYGMNRLGLMSGLYGAPALSAMMGAWPGAVPNPFAFPTPGVILPTQFRRYKSATLSQIWRPLPEYSAEHRRLALPSATPRRQRRISQSRSPAPSSTLKSMYGWNEYDLSALLYPPRQTIVSPTRGSPRRPSASRGAQWTPFRSTAGTSDSEEDHQDEDRYCNLPTYRSQRPIEGPKTHMRRLRHKWREGQDTADKPLGHLQDADARTPPIRRSEEFYEEEPRQPLWLSLKSTVRQGSRHSSQKFVELGLTPRDNGSVAQAKGPSQCRPMSHDLSSAIRQTGRLTLRFDAKLPEELLSPLCTLEGYSTRPSIETLKSFNESRLSAVEDFTVCREGYGEVTWPGLTDVRGLNVDEVVKIEDRSIEVYPEDYTEKTGKEVPEIGVRLNKAALVSLMNCRPKNSKLTEEQSEEFKEVYEEHLRKMRKLTEKIGAHFISLSPQWVWKFRVDHFSRYGYNEEEDEETESSSSSMPPPVVSTQRTEQLAAPSTTPALLQSPSYLNVPTIQLTSPLEPRQRWTKQNDELAKRSTNNRSLYRQESRKFIIGRQRPFRSQVKLQQSLIASSMASVSSPLTTSSDLKALCSRLGLAKAECKMSENDLRQLLQGPKNQKRPGPIFDDIQMARPNINHNGLLISCPKGLGQYSIKLRRLTMTDEPLDNSARETGKSILLKRRNERRQDNAQFLDELMIAVFRILNDSFGTFPLRQDIIDQLIASQLRLYEMRMQQCSNDPDIPLSSRQHCQFSIDTWALVACLFGTVISNDEEIDDLEFDNKTKGNLESGKSNDNENKTVGGAMISKLRQREENLDKFNDNSELKLCGRRNSVCFSSHADSRYGDAVDIPIVITDNTLLHQKENSAIELTVESHSLASPPPRGPFDSRRSSVSDVLHQSGENHRSTLRRGSIEPRTVLSRLKHRSNEIDFDRCTENDSDDDDDDDDNAEEMIAESLVKQRRLEILSTWLSIVNQRTILPLLKNDTKLDGGLETNVSTISTEGLKKLKRAFLMLTANDVPNAVNELLRHNQHDQSVFIRLALILLGSGSSSIGALPMNHEAHFRQLLEWQRRGAYDQIPLSILRFHHILAGCIDRLVTSEIVDWRGVIGLLLWYPSPDLVLYNDSTDGSVMVPRGERFSVDHSNIKNLRDPAQQLLARLYGSQRHSKPDSMCTDVQQYGCQPDLKSRYSRYDESSYTLYNDKFQGDEVSINSSPLCLFNSLLDISNRTVPYSKKQHQRSSIDSLYENESVKIKLTHQACIRPPLCLEKALEIFESNLLNILNQTSTPAPLPDWCITQRRPLNPTDIPSIQYNLLRLFVSRLPSGAYFQLFDPSASSPHGTDISLSWLLFKVLSKKLICQNKEQNDRTKFTPSRHCRNKKDSNGPFAKEDISTEEASSEGDEVRVTDESVNSGMTILKTNPVDNLSTILNISNYLDRMFCQQLEELGLWHHAVVVKLGRLQFSPSANDDIFLCRDVLSIISRHLPHPGSASFEDILSFRCRARYLTESLGVPYIFLQHCLAEKLNSAGFLREACDLWIDCAYAAQDGLTDKKILCPTGKGQKPPIPSVFSKLVYNQPYKLFGSCLMTPTSYFCRAMFAIFKSPQVRSGITAFSSRVVGDSLFLRTALCPTTRLFDTSQQTDLNVHVHSLPLQEGKELGLSRQEPQLLDYTKPSQQITPLPRYQPLPLRPESNQTTVASRYSSVLGAHTSVLHSSTTSLGCLNYLLERLFADRIGDQTISIHYEENKTRRSVYYLCKSILDLSQSLIKASEWKKSPTYVICSSIIWIYKLMNLQDVSNETKGIDNLDNIEYEARHLRHMAKDLYDVIGEQLDLYRSIQVENEKNNLTKGSSTTFLPIFIDTLQYQSSLPPCLTTLNDKDDPILPALLSIERVILGCLQGFHWTSHHGTSPTSTNEISNQRADLLETPTTQFNDSTDSFYGTALSIATMTA